MNKYSTAISISLLIAFLDQITKWLIRLDLPLYARVEVLPFFDITHLRNTGAAFGMLRDLPEGVRLYLFTCVLIFALVTIFFFLKNAEDSDRIIIYSLSLILGGAIGNSIDRFRLGYVTDFLDFHWFGGPHWPPFNLADSAITIGVVLILLDAFFLRNEKTGTD